MYLIELTIATSSYRTYHGENKDYVGDISSTIGNGI
jgi:hypothetical protein